MSQRAGRIIGITLLGVCLMVLWTGVVLLGKAYTMPAHVDERKAELLTIEYGATYLGMSAEQRARAANEIIDMRTDKWRLHNVGLDMLLIASTFTVFMIRFRLWDIRNLKAVTTPRTRWRLIGLAGVAWLGLIPAVLLELNDEYAQDDLTPMEDAGHGLFAATMAPTMILIWILSVFVCRFLVLRRVTLPVSLWCFPARWNFRALSLTTLYSAMACTSVGLSILSAMYSKWMTPCWLIATYVLLASRAALVGGMSRGGAESI